MIVTNCLVSGKLFKIYLIIFGEVLFSEEFSQKFVLLFVFGISIDYLAWLTVFIYTWYKTIACAAAEKQTPQMVNVKIILNKSWKIVFLLVKLNLTLCLQ